MSKVSASDFGYGGVNGHLSNFRRLEILSLLY